MISAHNKFSNEFQCFGHISHAHVNPAMTVVAIVVGKKTVSEGLVYFIAQILGAIIGFGLLEVSSQKCLCI